MCSTHLVLGVFFRTGGVVAQHSAHPEGDYPLTQLIRATEGWRGGYEQQSPHPGGWEMVCAALTWSLPQEKLR